MFAETDGEPHNTITPIARKNDDMYELELLATYLLEGKNIEENEILAKHAEWVQTFLSKYEAITKDNVMQILEQEVGSVFVHVLENAGVFKCTEEGRRAFKRFIAEL